MNAGRNWIAGPGASVSGETGVPGDKSISHRALMLAAIAAGRSEIHGFLEAEDCLATAAAFEAMGVRIEQPAPGHLLIHGVGMGGLRAPPAALDLGNSGTAMRLLAGILAAQAFDSVLIGDDSLMRRPMDRVAVPLVRMGADVRTNEGRPPIAIAGGRTLSGRAHRLEVASAQVKSALLLAGLHAHGRTSVAEPQSSRDHTERMLAVFGVEVLCESGSVSVDGPARPVGARIEVPGDFSSAAFLIVAALIAGSGPLILRGVGVNPTRTGLLEVLALMGAEVQVQRQLERSGEPVADIVVRPSRLRGVEVPRELVPRMIDEFPILAAAAAVAEGETVVTGAAELRVKESDRIAAVAEGLAALGIENRMLPDGIRLRGGAVQGGIVDSRGDHRIAMAFAVLAARASAPVLVRDVQTVATSFPGFADLARAVGLVLAEEG